MALVPYPSKKVLIGAGALLLILLMWKHSMMPTADFPSGEILSIRQGQSARSVADELESRGFVRSSRTFLLTLRALEPSGGVIAGDYQFEGPTSVVSIARRLSGGRYGTKQIRVTFPEGVSVATMATILKKELPEYPIEMFKTLAQPYEGYLFPDTYIISRTTTPAQLIQRMRDRFADQYQDIAGSSTDDMRHIVIMASILEGEARTMGEARMIAGILETRLSKGMPLQVDATFMYRYGIPSLNLTLTDLKRDDPYNTYINTGLPPTPIGNPGRTMLEAALNPEKSPYLFYLHDREGRIYYARTYAEHLANRRRAGL